MQLQPDSLAAVPPSEDGRTPGPDTPSALAARLDELESFIRATTELVDPKALKELRRTIDALAKRDPKFEERLTQRVGVLADRIETVAKTVSTSSAALAGKDGEIVQLRRELDAQLARVDAAIREAGRGADPQELAEIRRALDDLSKVSKQRMPRGLEGRVDELAAKFELVSQRLDSVSSTVSTTAAGLAGREGEMNALRRAVETGNDRIGAELGELRRAVDPRSVADVRQELKELADETARKLYANRQVIGQVATKVEALGERLDALAQASGSMSSRLSAAEQNVSAHHAYMEESGAHVKAVLSQQRESLTALAARADALAQAQVEAAQALEERISAGGDQIESLAGRLEQLDVTVTSTSERIDARDDRLEAMERRFEDATSGANALVADLSHALAELPDPNRIEQALAGRIDELAERTASLSDELSRVDTSLADGLDSLTASGSTVADNVAQQQQLLETLAARTAALEQSEGQAAEALAQRVAGLGAALDGLAGRLESVTDSMTSTEGDVSRSEEALSDLRAYVEDASGRLTSLLAEHRRSLAQQTESLAALTERTASLEEADAEETRMLDERRSETEATVSSLSQRVDTLAASLGSAVTSLDLKEQELAQLQGRFSESSSRIETVVEDIRDALSALPDASPEALDEMGSKVESNAAVMASLAARLEGLEAAHVEQVPVQVSERFDRIEARIAAVAAEMGRAKTLWPVALRSLEARLDDLVSHAPAHQVPTSRMPEAGSEDLLAGLRDSLQAMESVAEEVARASDAWTSDEQQPTPEGQTAHQDAREAASGGARIVPIRVNDP
ncbi:MAG TPA: hypothetical protein VHI53_05925 [Gaiellaceae bacterium]|nr:hypothetical protein [Gaiellaceae bacterium]